MTNLHPMSTAEMRERRAAKIHRDWLYQEAKSIRIGDIIIKPAIGKTGGADNIGWEMHRPAEVPQYYATQEQAEAAAKAWLAKQ